MRRFILIFLLSALFVPIFATADRASDLQLEINKRQAEIAKLDQQIADYGQQLEVKSKQSATLSNALATLNLTVKKLDSQIQKTETEIGAVQLTINSLNLNIATTSQQVGTNETALRELLRSLRRAGDASWLELWLGTNRLAESLAEEERLRSLQNQVEQSTIKLRELKADLGQQVDEKQVAKAKLESLSRQLADQKKILADERARQNLLLTQTKNQEANYKKLLSESQARRQAFAQELFNFESQLRLEVDQSKLPTARRGIINWPLDNPAITQYFGKTVDAARLYASGTHNGIDLRAPIGTPVKAVTSGVVAGTGDTDLTCRGASYGRWVLIKHDNGLASLSAHLSLIKAAKGQRVAAGEIIGYSGQTGYATGPHLHFTLAAADGVEISTFKSKVCAGSYTMPVFDTRAYLDPIVYLPS